MRENACTQHGCWAAHLHRHLPGLAAAGAARLGNIHHSGGGRCGCRPQAQGKASAQQRRHNAGCEAEDSARRAPQTLYCCGIPFLLPRLELWRDQQLVQLQPVAPCGPRPGLNSTSGWAVYAPPPPPPHRPPHTAEASPQLAMPSLYAYCQGAPGPVWYYGSLGITSAAQPSLGPATGVPTVWCCPGAARRAHAAAGPGTTRAPSPPSPNRLLSGLSVT